MFQWTSLSCQEEKIGGKLYFWYEVVEKYWILAQNIGYWQLNIYFWHTRGRGLQVIICCDCKKTQRERMNKFRFPLLLFQHGTSGTDPKATLKSLCDFKMASAATVTNFRGSFRTRMSSSHLQYINKSPTVHNISSNEIILSINSSSLD